MAVELGSGRRLMAARSGDGVLRVKGGQRTRVLYV